MAIAVESRPGVVNINHMLQQFGHQIGAIVVVQPLKAAKTDVGTAKSHHYGRAGGGGFIAAPEGFTGFHQTQGAGGGHPQGMEGFRRQYLPHPTLEGEAAIAAPGVGGGARTLGAQIVELAVYPPQLTVEKAPAIP